MSEPERLVRLVCVLHGMLVVGAGVLFIISLLNDEPFWMGVNGCTIIINSLVILFWVFIDG